MDHTEIKHLINQAQLDIQRARMQGAIDKLLQINQLSSAFLSSELQDQIIQLSNQFHDHRRRSRSGTESAEYIKLVNNKVTNFAIEILREIEEELPKLKIVDYHKKNETKTSGLEELYKKWSIREKFIFVDALAKCSSCSSITDISDKLIPLISEEIRLQIKFDKSVRYYLKNTLDTSAGYPNGLNSLLEALDILEGDSSAFKEVKVLLNPS